MAKKNGTLGTLKENWFVIVTIASLIASWTTLDNKMSNQETVINKHLAAGIKQQEAYHATKEEISAIKRDLVYLKEGVDKNENLSHEILKELKK